MKNKTNTIRKAALSGLAAIALSSPSNALSQDDYASTVAESPAVKYSVESLKENSNPRIHDVSFETGWHSKYLGTFGFSITETPVITSSLNVGIDNFNVNVFGNYDPKLSLSELDPSISTTIDTKYVKIRPEFTVFTFPSLSETIDSSFGITLASKGLPVDLSLFGVQAFGEGSQEGRLYQFTVGKTLPLKSLSERLTLNVSSTLTFNEHYFVNGNGFSVAAAGANVTYSFDNGYSLHAGVRGHIPLQDNFGGLFKRDGVFEFSLKKKF